MSTVQNQHAISRDSNGTLMTPEEFDAITDYDRDYVYELINGVLIVTPSPSAGERGPNDLLSYLLRKYQEEHPEGSQLYATLPEHTLSVGDNRRRADRVVWCGFSHDVDVDQDVPSIVIEMVSADRRDRERDYQAKRREYRELGVQEYWILDRFERQLTLVRFDAQAESQIVLTESDTLTTPLLPGFELPLSRWLAEADRFSS